VSPFGPRIIVPQCSAVKLKRRDRIRRATLRYERPTPLPVDAPEHDTAKDMRGLAAAKRRKRLYNCGMALRFLWLGVLALAVTAVRLVPAPAQAPAPRFWVAGRYDGNHIVVFFDTAMFKGTVPRTARTLAPAPTGFLSQKELPASYIAQLPRKPDAERFHTGDQYDLLMGNGRVVTVTLTTLVGYVSDDEDDDPSYIGALAKVNEPTALVGTRNYYALQRHDPGSALSRKPQSTAASASLATKSGNFASLFEEPLRLDLQTQIASLLTERMKMMATAEQRRQAENLAPTLAVQAFRLADGCLHYYARAEWRAEDKPYGPPTFALAAWMAPQPKLHILAVEKITSPYGFLDELPDLLNVVDLGDGRTGIIVNISGSGDSTLGLWEYKEGADLGHMTLFQSLVMDE
jgi:hypothetical protein